MTSLIRHVLFVFSGAFTQLDASLQHQYRQQQQQQQQPQQQPQQQQQEAEAKEELPDVLHLAIRGNQRQSEELPDVLHLAQTADFVCLRLIAPDCVRIAF